MADVERSSRIYAQELDLQPLAMAYVSAAVAGRYARHELAKPVVGEPEVHVALLGLRRGRPFADRDFFGEPGGDLIRPRPQDAGELQPGRACVVAVLGRLRPPELEVRDVPFDSKRAYGLVERVVDALAHASRYHRRHEQVGCWAFSVSSAWLELVPRVYVTVTRWLA